MRRLVDGFLLWLAATGSIVAAAQLFFVMVHVTGFTAFFTGAVGCAALILFGAVLLDIGDFEDQEVPVDGK